MNSILKKINHDYAFLLIRLMVGAVFLSEGIQKFLFPDQLGIGRFIKIGLPYPEFFGYFVPSFEIVCGVLVLIGLLTRLASIPLIIIMLVAIISTKISVLLINGFWEMAHAARTDWSMLIGSVILLLYGAGKFSADYYFNKKSGKTA
jgi:uncharacterized membrane protein YphA (DoxX/SURF4 family)